MKRFGLTLLALATALAISPAARADDFTFNYSGTAGETGTLDLQGANEGSGVWLITSGGGIFDDGVDSGTITLIPLPPGTPVGSAITIGDLAYNDLLYPMSQVGQFVDENGLLFQFADGDYLNLYYYFGQIDWSDNLGNTGIGTLALSSVTVTPEPGTLLLMGTGLMLLVGLQMRTKQPAGSAV